MKMKLFALSKENSVQYKKMLMHITAVFEGIVPQEEQFAQFSSLKEMLPSFAKALQDGENIVLALDAEAYNDTRKKLCAALSLEEEVNPDLQALLKNTDLSEAEQLKHARMPKGATVFQSKDGAYSAFLVEKGKQSIFFFPLEDKSLRYLLKHGVTPFFMERAIAQEPKEEPKRVEQPQALTNEVLEKTIQYLKENGQTVAVSGTPGAEALKRFKTVNPEFETLFTFTPHMEDKGEYNMTDYAALLAKSARELTESTFGASISEMSQNDGGDYICITVADAQTALVRKIYREEDESPEVFAQDAAEELLELIYEKSSGEGAVGIEVSNVGGEQKPSFFKTTGGKVLLSILVLLLATAIALLSVFFIQEKKREEQAAIEQQTVETTTEETTKEIVAPVIAKVPFTRLMYKEMLEGVQEDVAETTTATDNAGAAIDTAENAKPTTADIPNEIIVNGMTMDAKEAVARIVEAQMDNTYREEALKAQAICVYTYLKYRNTNWKITGVELADNYSDEVYNAVRSVFGEYLSFEGKPAFTPFFRLSAGKTTTAEQIYKKSFPYLSAVAVNTDKTNDAYKFELILPAEEVKSMIIGYDPTLELEENPREWIKIKKHDAAINSTTGYVETVSLCGKEISGMEFTEQLFADKNIPSTCLSFGYNKTTNEFKLTAYGIGYGVGMSQIGADKMAATGSTYTQILAKFFPATKVTV